ncbi:MAG: hypothetical protein AAFR63_11990 [Cyanobacteria bacterium J06631_6]
MRVSNPDTLEKVVDRGILSCSKPFKSWVTTNSLSSSKLNSFNSLNGGTPATAFRSNNRQGQLNPYLCKEESSE